MAATEWEKNIVPVSASELQPYADTTTFSRPMTTSCDPERDAQIMDFKSTDEDKPDSSYIMYLHRVFGYPHTSPDTMTDSDFQTAYQMANWSRCHHCKIIFKVDKRYEAHLRSKVINSSEEFICPQSPAFTELERSQCLYNCSLCKKEFDDSQRPKKALAQHLKAKKHMAKVNTELEHSEHQRLCDLVGISVD